MKRGRLPKRVEALRGYNLKTFLSDLTAGLTVGLVALPLAMAFAISSGVPPQAGLYCAVVAGFLISALGGVAYWQAPAGRILPPRRTHPRRQRPWTNSVPATCAS